jgi:plasmid stabilization system protein ParE
MAKLKIDYHPMARLEAMDAFDWYRLHNLLAAERFQRELEKAQQAIQDLPDAWPMYLAGTRHYLIKRFPYAVVYRLLESRIEIVAVAHARRKPGYWVDRLEDSEPKS